MHGILVVDKPAGMTSHDVVNRVRRLFGTKRVGHTGTLDPLATGVLVLCLGDATRIAEYLAADTKEYTAGVLFGMSTDTQDITGETLRETDASGLTRQQVETVLPRFTGSILQTPPMVSAVHHEGKRLYELARKGQEVERTPRQVETHRLELSDFVPGAGATATLQVECTTGTYIRTLVSDLGDALGVGGTMTDLRRSRAGSFTLLDAHTLDELASLERDGRLAEVVIPISQALSQWPSVGLNADRIADIRQGKAISVPNLDGAPPVSRILLLDAGGHAVALAQSEGAMLRPFKVFAGDR